MQQPQALLTDYPKLDVSPQPLEFHSENFNHEQLAVWLSNHPKFVGKGYQQDISKLKGMQMLGSIILLNNILSQHSLTLDARINGDVFLSLNESRLGQPAWSVTRISVCHYEYHSRLGM